jgi:hypothetical protein
MKKISDTVIYVLVAIVVVVVLFVGTVVLPSAGFDATDYPMWE